MANEPGQLRRGRTRDYTIPVRLNQFIMMASEERQRRRVVFRVRQLASIIRVRQFIPYLLVIFVVIISSFKVEQIHCDNPSTLVENHVNNHHHNHHHHPYKPSTVAIVESSLGKSVDIKQSNGGSTKSAATTKSSSSSSLVSMKNGSAIGIDNSNRKNREKLLSALNDNIERQHLKLPFTNIINLQQRPSKFDSGEMNSGGLKILHSTSGTDVKKSTASDELLKGIMRMHEHPATTRLSSSSSPSSSSSLHYSSTDNQLVSKDTLQQQLSAVKANSLLPNKVVSQLISYVASPFLGTGKLSGSESQKIIAQLLPNISLPLPTIPLNYRRPSTGRNSGSSSSSMQSPTKLLTTNPASVTTTATTTSISATQKPFLLLPNWMRSNRKPSTYSIKPSTLFGDTGSSLNSWTMLSSSSDQDLMANSSSMHHQQVSAPMNIDNQRKVSTSSRQNRGNNSPDDGKSTSAASRGPMGKWLKSSANQMAQNYLQDSLRGLLTLSQLPILPVGPVSTAPSVLEPQSTQQKRRGSSSTTTATTATTATTTANRQPSSSSIQVAGSSAPSSVSTDKNRNPGSDRRAKAIEDLYRYAYILRTSMVGRKRDPLKALSTKTRPPMKPLPPFKSNTNQPFFTRRSIGQMAADNRRQMINLAKALQQALSLPSIGGPSGKQQAANPRGVMWDMATDPTLVVTLMHLIERASVALPLGFLLMPIVQMIRNPLSGFNLGRMLPARALHRSVEHEILAKRLDAVDKVLSRALRPTHRESLIGKRK